eukprot:CAMPEP_0174714262 /NCGR_PEP_ID=MMETSP1094-20130205/17525_1 /TAXON_ID=156173 /ORGANISM="Chrysochromulina brevifilum, Strain UTEX LB 985" /LENGTH=48 /DNA_ID= /DNA_START= /DNA_END= /DNA_ORIENTATION=
MSVSMRSEVEVSGLGLTSTLSLVISTLSSPLSSPGESMRRVVTALSYL